MSPSSSSPRPARIFFISFSFLTAISRIYFLFLRQRCWRLAGTFASFDRICARSLSLAYQFISRPLRGISFHARCHCFRRRKYMLPSSRLPPGHFYFRRSLSRDDFVGPDELFPAGLARWPTPRCCCKIAYIISASARVELRHAGHDARLRQDFDQCRVADAAAISAPVMPDARRRFSSCTAMWPR